MSVDIHCGTDIRVSEQFLHSLWCCTVGEQIQQTEREIADKLDKIPDMLKADGYPDVQVSMATYRRTEPLPCGITYILLFFIDSINKSPCRIHCI